MKFIQARTTILIVGLFASFAVTGRAESPIVRNCIWCHGTSAEGYTPAPRLAGQRPQYIENQLAGFRTHARNNPLSKQYMWSAVENLDAGTAHDLAAYFSTLPAKAADDGNMQLESAGRDIYQDGIPELNIAACVVCHGPNGEGVAQIPRLGGLAYSYLKRRLEQWAKGYHAAAGPPMPNIASKLSATQVDALASYLSFIK
jgi:cytochrome c553